MSLCQRSQGGRERAPVGRQLRETLGRPGPQLRRRRKVALLLKGLCAPLTSEAQGSELTACPRSGHIAPIP